MIMYDYFMLLAILVSMDSKDPNTKVGACIVSNDNRIVSVGYNSIPNGFDEKHFPWEREGNFLNTKYAYVVHAERNAILSHNGYKDDLYDATIYVTEFPCNECAKEIVQSGIKHIIYLSDKYHNTESSIASRKILDECGITYNKLVLSDKIKNLLKI